MQISHVHGSGPLSRALLASLCLTLPAACGIDNIIITPGDPGDPADPGGPDAGMDATSAPDAQPVPEPEPENPQAIYYDLETFATVIQPAIDAAGCSRVACHERSSIDGAPGRLALFENPAAGSDEMWSNLVAVTSFVALDDYPFSAEDTVLYVRSTDRHLNAALAEPAQLVAWLQDAEARFSAKYDRFNMTIFASDIQPMLDAGCAFSACHGEGGPVFPLYAEPAPDSQEMIANLRAAADLVDLSLEQAEDTFLYVRATDMHVGPALIEDPELLAAWIQSALDGDGE